MQPLILASQSPRRHELMRYITYDFEIVSASIDECVYENESVEDYVVRMAETKAENVYQNHPESVVIGCDTIVSYKNEILGKPVDKDEAYRVLSLLSGKTHQVLTAVSIVSSQKKKSFISKAEVTFFPLTSEEIWRYIHTDEPMDKAGAYGIQGQGSLFVSEIKGDYYSIVGLPVAHLQRHLMSFIQGESL